MTATAATQSFEPDDFPESSQGRNRIVSATRSVRMETPSG
jgi:hypothetical protein